MRKSIPSVTLLLASAAGSTVGAEVAEQQPNPRQQPGAMITMFAPEQHDLYDGHYVLPAGRIYMVGSLNDPVGWDHMDNEAKSVKPVAGTAAIDVNDLTNTGTFEARLKIPEGNLVLAIDKSNEFNRFRMRRRQLAENVRVPRWMGVGHATLNGKPLYDNYEMTS